MKNAMKDTIEVEQKFRVENHETHLNLLNLPISQLAFSVPTLEVDIYYQHPAKDYKQTNELLRIRNWREIIYKGPKSDANVKVRPEFTWKTDDPELLLETLGFTKVLEVHKHRKPCKWLCNKDEKQFTVTIALDKIDKLGSFIEIEIITNKNDAEFAIKQVEEIAQQMNLQNIETKSYFELIQEKNT